MAQSVLGAVAELLAADGQLQSLVPSGVWVGDVAENFFNAGAPSQVKLPFVAVLHRGEVPRFNNSEAPMQEETELQIEAYAEGAAAAAAANPTEQIALRIKALLDRDRAALAVDGAAEVSVTRGRYDLELQKRRAPDANRVYKGTLRYTVTVQRNWPR